MATVEEMLLNLPRGYEDLSELSTISLDRVGEKVSLRGTVERIRLVRTKRGKMLVTARFTDTNGTPCEVVWFNQPHIKRMLSDGADIVLTGKLVLEGRRFQLQSPVFEAASIPGGRGDRELRHAGRIVPVYRQSEKLTTRWLREKMPLLREAIRHLQETLPASVILEENLMGRREAIEELHFPTSFMKLEKARERLAFEELFSVQKDALERKQQWQRASQERLKVPMDVELIRNFFKSLSFTPTESQRIAIYEILRDMEKDVPMSRLLEGDVGSGKTLVAVAVMANVISAGRAQYRSPSEARATGSGQCALMVPTEVLARQHAEGVTKMLLNFSNTFRSFPHSPVVRLLTGSIPDAEAAEIKLGIARGTVDLVIGTHALIQEDVRFADLKLVIIDEQHRFGVEQRRRLEEMGSPHVLSMTATPIPRTLALTAHGDHDLSVLLEKPGHRIPIVTKIVPPKDRSVVDRFVDRAVAAGRQAFVICPLIEESDELAEVKSATEEQQALKQAFPRRRIGLLHGRLDPNVKEEVMRRFKGGEIDILVSTAVIEVGIDVPNATMILIEGAERFGLAQLHQFRGRVGRSDTQSYCFLFTTTPEQARSTRLQAMVRYDSGFQLAEIDLRLRGPGELFGTRQSGIMDFRYANLGDIKMVLRARKAAERSLGMLKGE
jgi:ATP-dependent DNA helicase RecG